MIRTAAKALSVSMRLAASISTARNALNQAISPAVATVPYHPNLAAGLSLTSLLGQLRGYAPGSRAPDSRVSEDDDDFSEGDMDSEDFEIGGEGFPEDDDEGMIDEDSVDEDEVEDESD